MSQDIYGLLKHYRDGLSWYDEGKKETYVVLSTRDVQDMLERHWREQIAKEIENLLDPPPIDEVDHIVWKVLEKCADIARGKND